MKISEVKKKYRNQWILARVTKEKPGTHEVVEVQMIAHSPSRDKTYEALGKTRARHITHFYNGRIPKKGYAVAF